MGKKSLSGTAFDIGNTLFMIVCALIMLFPLWNSIMTSLVSVGEYYSRVVILWPKEFNFDSYIYIFSSKQIPRAFFTTVFITVVGSLYSMVVTTALAYGLSKKFLPGRNFFLGMITVTMFFSGGLIPYFLLIRDIHLMDKLAVLIIPSAVSTWNFLVIKTFFTQVPPELEESAKIDGASDITVFFRIVLPTSTPVLATFLLFYGVTYWNIWFSVLLYIRNPMYKTLQFVLRELIVESIRPYAMDTGSLEKGVSSHGLFDEGIKMATLVVATVPILCVYPFLQKYFTKGIMLGSIKG